MDGLKPVFTPNTSVKLFFIILLEVKLRLFFVTIEPFKVILLNVFPEASLKTAPLIVELVRDNNEPEEMNKPKALLPLILRPRVP